MGQAWGSCAPFHYFWQGQGIQNVPCQVQLFCMCLRLELQQRDKQMEQSKEDCPPPQFLKELCSKNYLCPH